MRGLITTLAEALGYVGELRGLQHVVGFTSLYMESCVAQNLIAKVGLNACGLLINNSLQKIYGVAKSRNDYYA